MTRQVVTIPEPVAVITTTESAMVTTTEPVATVTIDSATENVAVTVDETVAVIAAPAERIAVSIIEPAVSVIWPPGPSGPAGPQGPSGDDMPGSQAAPFNVNAVLESSTHIYVCMSNEDADWYIKRATLDASSVRHATALNNPSVTTYAAAEAGRLSLTYGRFDEAF